MYEIQSKSDFQSGATLIVRIPEEELDKKALYTILTDKPEFILPFRHRAIDGKIEFTYQVGNRSKIAYLSGNRSLREYSELWSSILQPLLDCGDWFMKPYSFVLKPEYLYCNKTDRIISFLYIPSEQNCSGYGELKNMVTEIARQNRVADVSLENKVVWAIQDFNPNDFLQMVKQYGIVPNETNAPKFEQRSVDLPIPQVQRQPDSKPVNEQNPPAAKVLADTPKKQDDIAINLSSSKKAVKGEKSKKIKPAPKDKGGFWGKKKKVQQEIVQGAAAMPKQQDSFMYEQPVDYDDGVTQLDMNESEGAKLRYVGSGDHPKVIDVDIEEGKVFTIGRFDASVGTKQSSFEFDKKAKAVSRRHAAVERNAEGYSIVDLSSAAGTFLNGQKLPPNAPFKLEIGCRVSFGYSGADYIWEE